MSQFTRNTGIDPIPKTDRRITTNPVRFYIYALGVGPYVDVPEGFEFDGCSIPICIFGPKISGRTLTPCALHDYLFETREYGFHFSNFIFYKALRVNNVGLFTGLLYLIGVTMFGRVSYYQIVHKISVAIKRRLKISESISNKFK